ncbi:CDP-alcohol phosphatidyltransferase family protein [Pontiellaceae bacterium B12219]|nr:CDP-alcohol phosphatidyltransferase family protein [Pontiellaceae bacterium B12219]
MASVYDLKPRFQDLLRSIVVKLADHGYTANQVTVAAALLSILTGALLMKYSAGRAVLLLLPIVLFVRMALNAIDGMLAREHDMKTPLGAILNELGDVISDAALYLPLALVPGFPPKIMVIIVVLAVISEMTGVIAVQIGASRRYDGPMGKSDRAFVFGALGFLLAIGLFPRAWVSFAMIIVCILLIITIVNRGRRALAEAAS